MEEKKKLIQFKNIVKSFDDGQVVLKCNDFDFARLRSELI